MNKAGKATMNLAIACLDVANRLRAKDRGEEVFPELPTSFDDWDLEEQDQLTPEEARFLRSLFALGSKNNSLRLPLLLASMTSPIVLLAPISLHKQSVNSYELLNVRERDIISMFAILTGATQTAVLSGNQKPRVIATVEKLIWATIFAVARGEVHFEEAVRNLAESLPWLEVEAETQNEWIRHWFDGVQEERVLQPTGAIEGVSEGAYRTANSAEDGGAIIGIHHDLTVTLSQVHLKEDLGNVSEAGQKSLDPPSVPHNQVTSQPFVQPFVVSEDCHSPAAREKLFLPDSDEERDEETPIELHHIRQPLFSEELPCMMHAVADNHHNQHTIRVVTWVSVCIPLNNLVWKYKFYLQSAFSRPLKRIIKQTTRNNSSVGIYYMTDDVYNEKGVKEVQRLLRNRPLIVTGKVTNRGFDMSSLGELHPLAMPIELSGKQSLIAAI
jgi:hypothetical protein